MQSSYRLYLSWLFVLVPLVVYGGELDTVYLSIHDAEQKFLSSNLQLIAARMNIEASKAAIIQAQIWSNPNIAIEQNIYNKFTGRYFDVTKQGNTELQFQQLFLLAGKRNKQIRLAEINSRFAENAMFDLLRTLKMELHTDLYDLFFLQKSLSFYDESIEQVKHTVESSELIYEKRSILLSEMLRLKSLLFTLETERLDLKSQISDIQTDLRVLLQDFSSVQKYYKPVLDGRDTNYIFIDSLSLDDARQRAYSNHPSLKMAKTAVDYEQTNLELQKALAYPDITVGGRYSRAGSYIPDYMGLTMSIDIPIFNRNQGNIQVSEATLDMNRVLHNQVKKNVEKEVTSAFSKAMETNRLFTNFDRKFAGQFRQLVDGMISNYQKRNISIIEFTDFIESYRSSMIQMNHLLDSRLDAFEELNFSIGSTFINF